MYIYIHTVFIYINVHSHAYLYTCMYIYINTGAVQVGCGSQDDRLTHAGVAARAAVAQRVRKAG